MSPECEILKDQIIALRKQVTQLEEDAVAMPAYANPARYRREEEARPKSDVPLPEITELRCWNNWCRVLVPIRLSREAYITDQKHSATFCAKPDCQEVADRNDRRWGIPPVEILRRRNRGVRQPKVG
jgi:hypothetical protein